MKTIKWVLFPIGKPIVEFFDKLGWRIVPDLGFYFIIPCKIIDRELDYEYLEGLRHLSFREYEGDHNINDDSSPDAQYLQPLILGKFNISSDEKPNMQYVQDYWNEHITKDIFKFLKEYEVFLPTSFSELKGIKGDLEETKIVLKIDSHPIKHYLYWLNPRVKEEVKRDIENMLVARFIVPMD